MDYIIVKRGKRYTGGNCYAEDCRLNIRMSQWPKSYCPISKKEIEIDI